MIIIIIIVGVVQELAEKHTYTAAEVGRVKIELNQTMSKLEGERSVHADIRDKLAQADKDLSGEGISQLCTLLCFVFLK